MLVHEYEPEADELVAALALSGIQSRRLWPPIHQQAPYRSAERLRGEVSDRIHNRGLSLPSSTHLSEAHQEVVMTALKDVFG